jgi:tetratricopeptide (TPR) repeat protein
MLAILYRALNRDDKALKVVQDLNARIPDDPATNDMLGDILVNSNQPGAVAQAVEALKRAAAKAPDDQYILQHLAEAYDKANDLVSARATYERVTQINPNGSIAFHKLALIYTRLGETKLAKQAATLSEHTAFNESQFSRIQDLSSRHPDDTNLHLIIADRLLAMKMYAPARDEYFRVLQLDPGNKRVPKEFLKAASTDIRQGLY